MGMTLISRLHILDGNFVVLTVARTRFFRPAVEEVYTGQGVDWTLAGVGGRVKSPDLIAQLCALATRPVPEKPAKTTSSLPHKYAQMAAIAAAHSPWRSSLDD